MPLSAAHIFNKLSEWPHRGTGSEDEMMAREMLTTELSGEPEVELVEEGFMAPATYLPFFWLVAVGQATTVWISMWMPYMAILAGTVFLASHLLFFDWRISPLVWLCPKRLTANLVAKKGAGQRLIILMAHLDSAPASYAYRPDQVRHFTLSVYLGTAVVALGLLVPILDISGLVLPLWARTLMIVLLLVQPVFASIDYWRFGYTPGANDNLSGVAAATAAASNLWRHMPEDCEVRLLITSAEEAGMLGAQHYWRTHRDELKARDCYVINFDTVGNQDLRYVVSSGGFTPVSYDGVLLQTAEELSCQNEQFKNFLPTVHSVGDFDSVWFVRDKIPSITIASYDHEGFMPFIHTPEDKAARVDMRKVELAAQFGEAVARRIPRV